MSGARSSGNGTVELLTKRERGETLYIAERRRRKARMITFPAPPEMEAELLAFYRQSLSVYSKAEVDALLAAEKNDDDHGPPDKEALEAIAAALDTMAAAIAALTQRIEALEAPP